MRVEALIEFLDIKANKNRKQGEQFECSEERYNDFVNSKFGKLVKNLDAPKKAPAKKVTSKKSETKEK